MTTPARSPASYAPAPAASGTAPSQRARASLRDVERAVKLVTGILRRFDAAGEPPGVAAELQRELAALEADVRKTRELLDAHANTHAGAAAGGGAGAAGADITEGPSQPPPRSSRGARHAGLAATGRRGPLRERDR